ncbi:MAG: hypothetical protein WBP00_06405, partial [Saprospiraceae bacterium]
MKLFASILIFICALSQTNAQEVGIIMGTARGYMQDGVENALIKLKDMGIKYLEGAGARGMNRTEYKRLLDKYGFKVIASGVNFDKLENADSVKAIIENLKFYGAQYAVCYWI